MKLDISRLWQGTRASPSPSPSESVAGRPSTQTMPTPPPGMPMLRRPPGREGAESSAGGAGARPRVHLSTLRASDRLSANTAASANRQVAGPSNLQCIPRMPRASGASKTTDKELLTTHRTAAFHQTRAKLKQFGKDANSLGGLCSGLSSVWVQLHSATQNVRPDCRLSTLASFEGMNHALIAQRSMEAHVDDFVENKKTGSHVPKAARQNMDEMFGLDRGRRPLKLTSSASKLAEAMSKVDGYASVVVVRIDHEGNDKSHEMAMHRHKDSDKITFFDPNMGEFEFTHEEAKQFLDELKATSSGKNDKTFQWELRNVQVNSSAEDTALTHLVEDARGKQAKIDSAWAASSARHRN